MPRPAILTLWLALLWLALAAPLQAQSAPPALPEPAVIQKQLDGWRLELERIGNDLRDPDLAGFALDRLRSPLAAITAQAGQVAIDLAPAVAALEAQLKQLAPAVTPKEGEAAPVESAALKAERDALAKTLAELQGAAKLAQAINLRADELGKAVAARQRALFSSSLLARRAIMLDPRPWLDAASQTPAVAQRLIDSFSAPSGTAVDERDARLLLLIVVVIGVTMASGKARRALFALARRARPLTAPDIDACPETLALARYQTALRVLVLWLVLPVLSLLLFKGVVGLTDLAGSRLERLLTGALLALLAGSAVHALARAVLAPGLPMQRLVDLDDAMAARLAARLRIVAIAAGLMLLAWQMAQILAAPLVVEIAGSALLSLALAASIAAALRSYAAAVAPGPEAEADKAVDDAVGPPPLAVPRSLLQRLILPLGWLAVVVIVGATLLGYVALARFAAVQVLWSAGILTLAHLLLGFADSACAAGFRADSRLGTVMIAALGLGAEAVAQLGVLLAGALRLVLIAAALLLLGVPWGLTGEDVWQTLRNAVIGFRVGGLTVSPSSILLAVLLFLTGIAVTRAVQGWLGNRLLPRTRMDVGLQNSIRTGAGYVGMVLAFLIAISYAGLDLQNIAIVAGALSVGIGFGLQSIVSNFVSGLILLAERPIKAGDLIEIGGEKGYVRHINVRSTEIQTFDRGALIVPNSTLVSGTVKNWMHRDTTGRVSILLGVDYGADPDQVRDLLLGCLSAHPLILPDPPPRVWLIDFGAHALQFQTIGFLASADDVVQTQSDLRFAILRSLRDAGIGIPYPQLDLHVKAMPPTG